MKEEETHAVISRGRTRSAIGNIFTPSIAPAVTDLILNSDSARECVKSVLSLVARTADTPSHSDLGLCAIVNITLEHYALARELSVLARDIDLDYRYCKLGDINAASTSFKEHIQHLMATWPKSSGNRYYPVPSLFATMDAEGAYNRYGGHYRWDGAYGDLRRELAQHIASSL